MSGQIALDLMDALRKDKTIWAQAPCEHEFRLSDSLLFYHSQVPTEANEWVKERKQEIVDLRKDLQDLRTKLTSGFTEKSVQVKLGKTVEKVVPMLPGFPYARHDCRALFDPIDYVAFVGLANEKVTSLDFLDVKSGNARLTHVQKAVKDAIEDRKVSLEELGK